jgi:hypothetical protein
MGSKRTKKITTLPKTIELISSRTGVVREFKTDHAFRILTLQKQTGQGSYELFNTHLYRYEDTGIQLIESKQPKASKSPKQSVNRAEPIRESNDIIFVGEDKKPEEQGQDN